MINIFAIDPLLVGDLLWTPLLIVLLKVLAVFVTGLVATMLMVWFERKVVAGMGNRIGPNKAGPFGLLQTLADGTKLFFKEDLIPERADRFVFKIAPFLSFVPAFLFNHPARRRLSRRQRRHGLMVWRANPRTTCRPTGWRVVCTCNLRNRRLRHHACWLGQRF